MPKITKSWQTDRKISDKVKLEKIKRKLQKMQINNELSNNVDALLLFLIRSGMIK